MTTTSTIKELIEVKKLLNELTEKEAKLKQSLLEEDFEYEKIWTIEVSKKQRSTITLTKEANLKQIRELYPNLCETIHWIDQKKLTPEQFEEIKVKYTDAYYEDISVDTKKLHEVSKDFTQQKVTTFIEVRGI